MSAWLATPGKGGSRTRWRRAWAGTTVTYTCGGVYGIILVKIAAEAPYKRRENHADDRGDLTVHRHVGVAGNRQAGGPGGGAYDADVQILDGKQDGGSGAGAVDADVVEPTSGARSDVVDLAFFDRCSLSMDISALFGRGISPPDAATDEGLVPH